MLKHPMQPVWLDDDGKAWFKKNNLVAYLLDRARAGKTCDLNDLATQENIHPSWRGDYAQLAQLIGYSVDGFGELQSYVTDGQCRAAEALTEVARKRGKAK